MPVTANALQPALASCLEPGASCRDGFVAVVDSSGSALLFSTYLGTAGQDRLNEIAVDGDDRLYVASRHCVLAQPGIRSDTAAAVLG